MPELATTKLAVAGGLRKTVGILLAAGWLSFPSAAASAGATSSESPQPFAWVGPDECPSAGEVLRSLGELIDLERARWDRFRSISGRVARQGDEWELELVFDADASPRRRRFRARDCASTAELAAVTLALALDPEGEEPLELGPGTTAAFPSAPAPVVAGEKDAPSSEASLPIASVPIGAEVGLAAILDPNALGPASFGISAWGTARRSRVSLGLHADWLPSATVNVGGGGEVRLSLAAAGVSACFGPSGVLGFCAELEAGAVAASGRDLDGSRSVRDLWLAPGASVELGGALVGPLAIISRVTLLAPLVRGRYLVNDGELAHETPALALRLGLGVLLPVR